MGSGASRKQSNCNGAQVSGVINKTIALAPPECQALEEEVRWLRLKLEEEQMEKEWMMSRQAPASSSTATQNGAAPLFLGPEEDLVWLRRAWDVEKKEKAWLMARFEAIEAKLKTKNEECSVLRSLISANQTGSQPEFRDGTSKIGLPAPELRDAASKPWLPGQPVVDPVSPTGVDPISPISPNSSGKLSLKERRGLKLGVTTSGLATNHTVGPSVPSVCTNDRSGTSVVVDQSDSSIDKPTRAVSSEDGVPTLGPKEIKEPCLLPSPAQRSTFNYNNLTEPMSPLLARRMMKSPKGSDVRQPLLVLEPESDSAPKLCVNAVKMSSLDMVPHSPKRAKRKNDDFGEASGRVRSFSNVPCLAPVAEAVEAEQRPNSPTL